MRDVAKANKQKAELAALRADRDRLLELTRRIGHDLNNVLHAIMIKADQISREPSDQAPELSEAILTSISSGADLIRQLLSIAPGGAPADSPAAVAIAPLPVPALPLSVSPAGSSRILVVDDQQTIRELTQAMLAKAGYEVAVAANGAEAVAAVSDAGFDLVLMDVHMPVMNGITATRKIRQIPGPRSSVPIVGISGNVPLQHVQSLLAAGMNDHLGKPFRRAALLHKVDAWLNKGTQPQVQAEDTAEKETAFDEACKLMGRPWAISGLIRLDGQINEAFSGELAAITDKGQLAGQAHALVSLSALLGFSDLSQLCSTLEEACRSGADLHRPFEQAKTAAAQVHKTAAGLIASA